VQPVGSLSCAGRPNLQLAGPSVLARPLVQPAENSCFSIGNTPLQPARPAGSPFSVIPKFETEPYASVSHHLLVRTKLIHFHY